MIYKQFAVKTAHKFILQGEKYEIRNGIIFDEKTEKRLLDMAKKIAGQFVEIGLVKITFPVEKIFTVNLGL